MWPQITIWYLNLRELWRFFSLTQIRTTLKYCKCCKNGKRMKKKRKRRQRPGQSSMGEPRPAMPKDLIVIPAWRQTSPSLPKDSPGFSFVPSTAQWYLSQYKWYMSVFVGMNKCSIFPPSFWYWWQSTWQVLCFPSDTGSETHFFQSTFWCLAVSKPNSSHRGFQCVADHWAFAACLLPHGWNEGDSIYRKWSWGEWSKWLLEKVDHHPRA